MNWFLVKLVFKIANQQQSVSAEFDEQYRLVEAQSETEALAKAKILGVKNEFTTNNELGNTISWEFIDVAYIKRLEGIKDGLELFSTTHAAEYANEYIKFVHHQAEITYNKYVPHAVIAD